MEKKKIAIIATSIAIVTGVVGTTIAVVKNNKSSKPVVAETKVKETYEQSMKKLNNAKSIVIKKDLISIGKSYDVEVDGKSFGSVDGDFIKITGDKFVLTNDDGTILSSEKQVKRWGVKLNRLAEVKNNKDETVGFIGEERLGDLLKWGFNFHFYDKSKTEIGYLKQDVFNIFSTFEIFNVKDNKLAYEINANFSPIQAKYTITVHDDSVIPVDQAIYMTCILNAVNDSKKAENKKVKDKAIKGAGVAAEAVKGATKKKETVKPKTDIIDTKKKPVVDTAKKPVKKTTSTTKSKGKVK